MLEFVVCNGYCLLLMYVSLFVGHNNKVLTYLLDY